MNATMCVCDDSGQTLSSYHSSQNVTVSSSYLDSSSAVSQMCANVCSTAVSISPNGSAEGPDPPSPYFQSAIYIMYCTIFVLGLFGNGLVCYIVLSSTRMRTVTNFFIVNLAVGDILMTCFCVPFSSVSTLLLQFWPFGAVMCRVVSYSQAVSVFVSAYTLVAISIDRYVAILYPLRPRMTRIQAKLIIALVWVIATLTALPIPIVSRLTQPADWFLENDRYICQEVWDLEDARYYYSMALMVLQYFLPLFVLIFSYTRIARAVWGKKPPGEAEDNRDQRMARAKRKMIKMMVTVVIVYTICWLPFNVLLVLMDQFPDLHDWPGVIYTWFAAHWLAMSHACYNPMIYCWMNVKFRTGFRSVFSRIPCLQYCTHTGFLRSSDRLQRSNTVTTTYTSVRTSSHKRFRRSLYGRSLSRTNTELIVFNKVPLTPTEDMDSEMRI